MSKTRKNTAGPVARQVLKVLEKEKNRRTFDFDALRIGAERAAALERGVVTADEMRDLDPLHAVYAYAQNKQCSRLSPPSRMPYGKLRASSLLFLSQGRDRSGRRHSCNTCAKKGRRYITLDDMTLRSLAREDPALFLQRFPPLVLIDQIQYALDLLPRIKMEVDASR